MRVQPGAGLQLQGVSILARRPDAREGRADMPHDRLCAPVQDLAQVGRLGEGSAHIGAHRRLTRLLGPDLLHLLAIFDVGARAIPFSDMPRVVAQRHTSV